MEDRQDRPDRSRGACPTPLVTLPRRDRAPGLLQRLGHVAGPEGRPHRLRGQPGRRRPAPPGSRRLVQLLRLPGEADAGVAVRVPSLRHRGQGADLRQPRHRRHVARRRSSRRCRTTTRAAGSSRASARTRSSTARSTRRATTASPSPTRPRSCRAARRPARTTVTGTQASVSVATGVTCVTGATVSGAVTVAAGASAGPEEHHGRRRADRDRRGGRAAVRLDRHRRGQDLGLDRVTSRSPARRSAAGLALTGNTQVSANDRYSRLAGAYGPILAGSTVNGAARRAPPTAPT